MGAEGSGFGVRSQLNVVTRSGLPALSYGLQGCSKGS